MANEEFIGARQVLWQDFHSKWRNPTILDFWRKDEPNATFHLTLYGDKAAAKHQESWLVNMHGRKPAADCVKCGACEKVCPQHIKIREELEKASIGVI